ncbi:hypothetical protein AUP74_01787 [Microbulbifer aggregans]|uniref:Endonuclease/exonuclease/phosphatase domain-containing protein n=1 Tax=Microbulbifer aggregans TaxID=1769779 RepID=A0A1C9W7W1_9GAMM|nr:endonuclease/exonuclease/phosphatase family protein [Microbulbifer aggregans]AOS97218.1 hypothetical protein AUP74_01787 [Microbulbifer aggregans]
MLNPEFLHLVDYFKWEIIFLVVASLSILLRKWRLAFVGIACIGAVFVGKTFGVNTTKPDIDDVSIVSFSVRSGNNQAISDIGRVLELAPDVILFQEVILNRALENVISEAGYSICSFHSKASLIAAKRQITNCELHGNVIEVEVEGYSNTKFFNIHAPKFFVDLETYNDFFEAVIEIANTEDPNVVIGGDFNSLVTGTWRKKLKKIGFVASIDELAAGFKTTFPASGRRLGVLPPLLAIDDIYVKGLTVVQSKVIYNNSGSDHFPIVAYIENPEGAESENIAK